MTNEQYLIETGWRPTTELPSPRWSKQIVPGLMPVTMPTERAVAFQIDFDQERFGFVIKKLEEREDETP